MTPRTVRHAGERALLVECADLGEVLGLHAVLTAAPLPGQLEVLPAARTLFVRAADRRARDRLVTLLRDLPAAADARPEGDVVQVDTVYDGADLAEVAALTAMSADAVVAAHTGQVWTAAFGGFAPGFAYLVGEHAALDVPRRATPRTAVPAGAVGLAGHFSAVYPRRSPGGWQLLGRTAAPVWDLDRDPPALLRPGARVRFRAVREVVTAVVPTPPAAPVADEGPALVVLAAGTQSLVQDLGRPGRLDLGVSPSGAADRGSARQANRLVGNPREAAVVETVLGGLALRAVGDHVLAVSGARAPLTALRDGSVARTPPTDDPFALYDGEELRVGHPDAGLRVYLAVRGGLAVAPVLGSRSTDVLSGTGPAPLATGTVLPVGPPPGTAVARSEPPRVAAAPGDVLEVPVTLGPREDWVTPESVERLLGQEWTVGVRSNRVGVRLEGAALDRADDAELASEGTVAGAVQVPADGQPVVFLADHPVTGGYPVVAVVRDAALDTLAQVRPGDRVRFRLR
ncbi:5-oxoprolinase/urea amidolyase family protein [Georgenia wutianyii]|uniref:5-oxoprolinase/urea amidolyase family protein n=1 Tax=Georgenia wutianyii TaxID=2585135 RepID=A0ABX5VPE8_9MICO|nr:5-oxoprolinase/urea amidolyase family protein [Georgenia wutianyii]QDB79253.1 5-oxoprolinase/urea amidolyase family protein [Georgenia wutianyii]